MTSAGPARVRVTRSSPFRAIPPAGLRRIAELPVLAPHRQAREEAVLAGGGVHADHRSRLAALLLLVHGPGRRVLDGQAVLLEALEAAAAIRVVAPASSRNRDAQEAHRREHEGTAHRSPCAHGAIMTAWSRRCRSGPSCSSWRPIRLAVVSCRAAGGASGERSRPLRGSPASRPSP